MQKEIKKECEDYLDALKRHEEIMAKYPLDPPNKASNKAVITGILIENSFHTNEGDCIDFFEVENEKVFVWTQKESENSVLLVEVDEKVKDKKCWITLASIIDLSWRLWTCFERSGLDDRVDYKWIYYFDPKINIEKSTFYEMRIGGPDLFETLVFSSGLVMKLTEIAEMAHIIELLCRDEKAYTATANLRSSFDMSFCCLICEMASRPWHNHIAKEPELWEHISVIQEMEIAIVQACRAVEAILGEPPSRKNVAKVFGFKQKWKTLLGIDADTFFKKGEKSYLDFYYELFFELRNSSAHSRGDVHYNLLKKSAVAAQCFAAEILYEYINTNAVDNIAAREKLSFNNELLSRMSQK